MALIDCVLRVLGDNFLNMRLYLEHNNQKSQWSNESEHMIDWDCEIQPHIEPFFDSDSNTFSYLVQDPNSLSCAVIDSVLDV